MGQRDRNHLIVTGRCTTDNYAPIRGGGSSEKPPKPGNRRAHGTAIRAGLDKAEREARVHRERVSIDVPGAVPGAYVEFESFPGIELALESLDSQASGPRPELRAVRLEGTEDDQVQVATVFVPEGAMVRFLKRVDAYLAAAEEDEPAHRNLLDRISEVRRASVEALWTDPGALFPREEGPVWWELWLRRRDGDELARLATCAAELGFQVKERALGFDSRLVVLVEATVEQLGTALAVLDDIAELRSPRYRAEFLDGLTAFEQGEFVEELADRVIPAPAGSPVVCVIDTGVHRNHPLLERSLAEQDCHAADPAWQAVTDDGGHGTKMAGLALYGDLGAAIETGSPIELEHRLESLKLLPPRGANDPELYGSITAGGISAVEVGAPGLSRAYAMAITTESARIDDSLRGRPTSWSASLDALIVGRDIDQSVGKFELLEPANPDACRLIVVSAGNVRPEYGHDHLTRSDVEPIEDPAQSWNALTVGAFTDVDSLQNPSAGYEGWSPLVKRGELSPFSRTSVTFGDKWPIKPDVVLEGGNLAESPGGTERHPLGELALLTTAAPPRLGTPGSGRQLTTVNATSAATAQAAHLAAQIMAAYPHHWPETVRALIVHSAEWTPVMRGHLDNERRKRDKRTLLRRYGMGVPSLARATRSASDALTLVVEETITPFRAKKLADIHFHDLPWPGDTLLDLGGAEVRLRVTLSYYVEPNPADRGWKGRYRYASHGLRFDVRRSNESRDEFTKRVNAQALAEGEERPDSVKETGEWVIGADSRSLGSLHSDIWTGTASDLAQRGIIAVYPVGGWWKNDPGERQARYALVVSIETPGVDTDIYTPVAQQLQIPITT
ncbi:MULTISPECIES: S8 family peptidase [Actinosynnema]|uniref:S8 family peptidase n=1 Tax=Actinosynnema TaxID=40566 RepID=UPI0020A240EF|nr:S8 family peptidase [Actinosynnema pretiosum]MCP2098023.1 Subtilase family protein [Actinosynnema pretiosum]